MTTTTHPIWNRLSSAQRSTLAFLLVHPHIELRRPGGQPDSGRRAANFDRTVRVLSDLGLVTAHRRYSGGIASSINLTHPAPFMMPEVQS